MWYIAAVFFVLMGLYRVFHGAGLLTLAVFLLFAWFAIFLNKSGLDIA